MESTTHSSIRGKRHLSERLSKTSIAEHRYRISGSKLHVEKFLDLFRTYRSFFRLLWLRSGGGRHVTFFSRGYHTSEGTSFEDQHGRAALKARVPSLALPVAVARFA